MSVLSLTVAFPVGSRWRWIADYDDAFNAKHSGEECEVEANADARYLTIGFDDGAHTWAVPRELHPLADVPRGDGSEDGL